MLKIYLVSVLPVQPSFFFCFSLFFFPSAPPFFQFSATLFLFSFLFWSAPPFLLLFSAPFFCLQRLTSSFLQTCCPFFFQPKTFLLQPKTFFSSAQNLFFSPKPFSAQNVFASAQNLFQFSPKPFFQPKTFSSPRYFFSLFVVQRLLLFFFCSATFLSFNVLPFSPSLVQPSIFKTIKKSSFGSVYPRPNILSSCFTSLLFE